RRRRSRLAADRRVAQPRGRGGMRLTPRATAGAAFASLPRSAMVRRKSRSFPVRSTARPLVKLAAVGALVAALALSGCGRKGPLDPPPAAAVPPPADGQPATTVQPDGTTPPTKKRFILEWLLDYAQ